MRSEHRYYSFLFLLHIAVGSVGSDLRNFLEGFPEVR